MVKKSYEDFSLSLALFDALPVIFFSVSMLMIAARFNNVIFIIGAVLCTLSGIGKVSWKILLAGLKKDVWILNKQMRFLMPAGFVLMIVGCVVASKNKEFILFISEFVKMPSVLFLVIAVVGMAMMIVFAFKLDSTKSKSNWTEQITNALAQASFMISVILACVSR